MSDTVFCLSFCDPDLPEGSQYLGTCIIPASSHTEALTVSHLKGCNPGGEVAILGPIPIGAVKPDYIGRLLTAQEADEAGIDEPPTTSH